MPEILFGQMMSGIYLSVMLAILRHRDQFPIVRSVELSLAEKNT